MKPESYAALEPLLSGRLKKGNVTNAFLSREEYERELAAGLLTVLENEDGLLLLRERGNRRIMNFYLSGPRPPMPADGPPIVTEIAFRQGDGAMSEAVEFWKSSGFREKLRRVRLKRPKSTPPPRPDCVAPAGEPDIPAAMELLNSGFDPLTGCVPTEDGLIASAEKGLLLCARDKDGLSGLLHLGEGRNETRILHLIVREDRRGEGLAGELVRGALAMNGGRRSTVWTGEDNAPALRAYEKLGFERDGHRSVVLIKQ